MVVRFQRNRVVGTRSLGVAYIHDTKILGSPHFPRGKNNLLFPKHNLSQCLSQDLETGCLKLAVVKFWGVQILEGDHNILIFQP